MKLYFVGIGGIGTSALAQLCAGRGDTVLGSNLGKTAIWPQLEQAEIQLFDEHHASQIPSDTDILIYSEAVPEDNPERVQARELDIPEQSYFEHLGQIAKDYRVLAITGTHGKTTTTAMIASGMIAAHFPATMIVGSKLREFNGSNFFQIPDPSPDSHEQSSDSKAEPGLNSLKPWLIVEACEYRNNFQYLAPEIVVLTNAELDHVDYYRDEDHYVATFRQFCNQARTIICHRDDPLVDKILLGLDRDIVRVDVNGFTLPLDLPGLHNRKNAALALAAAEEIQDLNHKKFKKGLKHYQGAWRRLELLSDHPCYVYDDYGHHPTEIKATMQALREKYPVAKIALIFEPHQYSRTKEFFAEFLESFQAADEVALYPIYAARDSAADQAAISRQTFIDQDTRITRVDDLETAQLFTSGLTANDVLIFMGAGDISRLAHDFVSK